jgi:hypothetical protein
MNGPGDSILAERILDTMRQHLRLSVGVIRLLRPGEDEVWRIDASDASGQSWRAEHEDYYRAAVMLAELVGVDLED